MNLAKYEVTVTDDLPSGTTTRTSIANSDAEVIKTRAALAARTPKGASRTVTVTESK